MRYVFLLLCSFILFIKSSGLESVVTFVIFNQKDPFNERLVKDLKADLKRQYQELKLTEPQIYTSQECSNSSAHWTIFPLIAPLLDLISLDVQWIIFLEDFTRVVVQELLNELAKYDSFEEIWIGHALHDSEATIIHHFAFHENPSFFKYPNLGSGFAISVTLLKRLKSRLERGFKQLDFHIDASHEFALFVYDKGKGLMIKHSDKLCPAAGDNCATYPKTFEGCENSVDSSSIFFAIKTCQKFHNDRVPVVKGTWFRYAMNKAFFSDKQDPDIPTVTLNTPNTEQGHCQKTLAILQYLVTEFNDCPDLNWVTLVDDDTILSVAKIVALTTCHTTSLPTILGERYLFGMQGFNYPTGGAGILINRAAVNILAQKCTCPQPDAPDDMVLGACAEDSGIALVHVPQMHQARWEDYAVGRLATKDAITFHKHWMINPIEVYQKWFLEYDKKLAISDGLPKTEL